MNRRILDRPLRDDVRDSSSGWDLNHLLHPARAFDRPSDVVDDPDLTLNEKRAILASWASDACALEVTPHLRAGPTNNHPVPYDEVMDALRSLDKLAYARPDDSARYRRLARRSRLERCRSRPGGEGPSLT